MNNTELQQIMDTASTEAVLNVRAAFAAGQRDMLNRLSRIAEWADESSNIELGKLREMIRTVFAEERARLGDD